MEAELETEEIPEDVFFVNYKPPSRDAVTLPNHIIYLLLASIAAIIALYAIIRHLIKDLIHDLADFLFGEQPEEETSCPWEVKDKFQADWCPETSAELEAMVQAEEVRVMMDGQGNLPAIWVISDGRQPRQPRSSPRVAFGRTS